MRIHVIVSMLPLFLVGCGGTSSSPSAGATGSAVTVTQEVDNNQKVLVERIDGKVTSQLKLYIDGTVTRQILTVVDPRGNGVLDTRVDTGSHQVVIHVTTPDGEFSWNGTDHDSAPATMQQVGSFFAAAQARWATALKKPENARHYNGPRPYDDLTPRASLDPTATTKGAAAVPQDDAFCHYSCVVLSSAGCFYLGGGLLGAVVCGLAGDFVCANVCGDPAPGVECYTEGTCALCCQETYGCYWDCAECLDDGCITQ